MHGNESPDAAQLGLTRWLAAVALALSAIALLVMVAMAWTLTPAQPKHDVEQAKAHDTQAEGALTRQTAPPDARTAADGRRNPRRSIPRGAR